MVRNSFYELKMKSFVCAVRQSMDAQEFPTLAEAIEDVRTRAGKNESGVLWDSAELNEACKRAAKLKLNLR